MRKLRAVLSHYPPLIKIALQFTSYGIIGATCAALDFMLFLWLSHMLPAVWANSISVAFGILASYSLNSRITFSSADKTPSSIVKFFAVGITGLFISDAGVYLLTGPLGWTNVGAKALSLPIVAVVQFLLNRNWTFRRRTAQSVEEV
jgi:putative flippase GtrA